MTKFGVYPSYLFKSHDPILDEVDTIIKDSGETFAMIERSSGVTRSTLVNWRKRKTKRPQHATVRAVARALGYDWQLVKVNHDTAHRDATKIVHLNRQHRRGTGR